MMLGILGACHAHRGDGGRLPRVELRTDSAEYSVRIDRGTYRLDVGYTFLNRTGNTLSMNVCRSPSPPVLEKEVAAGQWVRAYTVVELMCLTEPPFRVASAATYRGVVQAQAPLPGGRFSGWMVDSIPGMFRLKWALHASADPNDRAGTITAVSAPFAVRGPI